MSMETNKATVRRYIEEVWNGGNLDAFDELVVEAERGAVATSSHGNSAGQMKKLLEFYRSAFPDLQVCIEQLLAEGDAVMVRWTLRGTHRGVFRGIPAMDAVLGTPVGEHHIGTLMVIPPTERRVSFHGVLIFQMGGGKIASVWVLLAELDALRQLGALPPAASQG
jgi:predicted ester cyclase